MNIRINEDGSVTVTAARYTASYGKDGKLKSASGCFKTISGIPKTLVIHNAFEPKAEKQQASKTYSAGMTLAVDEGTKAGVTADSFKVCDSERKVRAVVAPLELAVDINANAIINEIEKAYRGTAKQARLSSAVINSAKIPSIPDDDHIRQIIREEIRQFVNRELRQGGLFSR
ncbi:hypothetical protein [Xenorhabdus entomophaga]|uniref:hypothetical protein n=1 Tax=Xenorhabdus entomophaga TaxID=3136257 RepID=UPI0030F3C3EA